MGVIDLGLSDDAFWGLTPRLLVLLSERKREAERRMDLRFGVVASLIYNANRGKGRPMGPEDFFPGEKRARSAEEMRAKIEGLNDFLAQLKDNEDG